MNLLTLIVWGITALGGIALLAVWMQHGGMDRGVQRRFARPLPLLHGGAAVVSLLLFLVYWMGNVEPLREIVLAGLLVTAILGFVMFGKWLARPRHSLEHSVGAMRAGAPEDRFPTVLVIVHGIGAVATLGLYIFAAYIVAT